MHAIEELTISCQDCKKSIGEIVITESNDERRKNGLHSQKIKFKITDCPRCGGSSKESKIFAGSAAIHSPDDRYYLENIDYIEENGIINFQLKVVKK